MALRNAALDLVDFLAGKSAGGVALVKGANLFAGRGLTSDVTPTPAVSLLNTGGPAPAPLLSSSRSAHWTPTVQLRVRGPVDDVEAGEALARGVVELLHQAEVPGYVQVLCRDSAPTLLELDSGRRGIWVTNLECHYVAALT